MKMPRVTIKAVSQEPTEVLKVSILKTHTDLQYKLASFIEVLTGLLVCSKKHDKLYCSMECIRGGLPLPQKRSYNLPYLTYRQFESPLPSNRKNNQDLYHSLSNEHVCPTATVH